MTPKRVCDQPEPYRTGWVAGFYDGFCDDGLRYLDDILRYGVQGDQCRALFLSGYREGRVARRGHVSFEDTVVETIGGVEA
jgi:hypothetical protein